jgi:23S rRNA (uracil1939-C5)-methyltransferase
MSRRAERPVETATIRDSTIDGRGVADTPGKTVFVDSALKGEVVRFQRQRKRRNFDQASLIEVVESAAVRVEPECEYFGICGGCSLQHIEHAAQVELKQQSLLEQLKRIGGVQPLNVLPALAGQPYGYRRRARLGARYVEKKQRLLVGFREKHKPYIADMQRCQTLAPQLSVLIAELGQLIGRLSIVRQVPQVELSLADNALAIVLRIMAPLSAQDRELLLQFEQGHAAFVWLQTGGPDTLELLSHNPGEAALHYRLSRYDLTLEFGPLDFIQVNAAMNERMVSQALELAQVQATDRVLDLFCGIGNFSLPLAQLAREVVGVELDPAMVARAGANAVLNQLPNARFVAADLSKPVDPGAVPDWWQGGFDLVLLDPPRSGAQEVLANIAASGARRIVYVSCHPGSLARDAAILTQEHSFTLAAAGAMDMFPQTSHAEAMAVFERTA